MIRFLHAADFHLDSAFGALPAQRAAERRRESRELLFRLADYVNGHDIDLVLLAGADRFESDKLTLFVAPAALLLCLNAFGRFVMQGVVVRNFRMASAGSEHTAAVPLQDAELTARLAETVDTANSAVSIVRPLA